MTLIETKKGGRDDTMNQQNPSDEKWNINAVSKAVCI